MRKENISKDEQEQPSPSSSYRKADEEQRTGDRKCGRKLGRDDGKVDDIYDVRRCRKLQEAEGEEMHTK